MRKCEDYILDQVKYKIADPMDGKSVALSIMAACVMASMTPEEVKANFYEEYEVPIDKPVPDTYFHCTTCDKEGAKCTCKCVEDTNWIDRERS